MMRVLSILAAVAALTVSAAPVASAGTSMKPPSQTFLDQPEPTSVSHLSLRKAPPKSRLVSHEDSEQI
jgi:hypothetical protein